MVSAAHCDNLFGNKEHEKKCVEETNTNGAFKQGLVFSQKLQNSMCTEIFMFFGQKCNGFVNMSAEHLFLDASAYKLVKVTKYQYGAWDLI